MMIAPPPVRYRIRDKKVYRLFDGVESRCWFGWSHNLEDDFGEDPSGIEPLDRVRTLGGVEATVLSIDDAGYARLEGVQSVRYVGHLKRI